MELLLEKFKVNNKCQLNSEDISSLTLLYLPLIGIDSFALYSTLTCLEINKEYFIKKLIISTNIQTLKQLTSSFDKLEGMGLVKTYYHKDKGYLFDIIKPLSEPDFLKEEILVSLLENQIGNEEITELKNKYKPINKSYKDMTKKLNEVFTVTTKSKSDIITNMIKPTITVENPDFNYSLFKMLFDSSFISEEVLSEEKLKNMVLKISFIYKLNEDEMKDVVFKSFNNDQRCDYPSLSKYARMAFQNKYKTETPKLVTVKEDSFVQSESDDVFLILSNRLESQSPSEVLEELSGMKPTPTELKICEDLSKNTNLTIGAINFMMMYVSKEKDGELPSYNYFEKIASTWSRAKVKNAYDAIKYIEKKKQEKNTPKEYKKNKKEAPLPDWYTEYEKNLQDTEKQSEVSNEELAKMAKKLFED